MKFSSMVLSALVAAGLIASLPALSEAIQPPPPPVPQPQQQSPLAGARRAVTDAQTNLNGERAILRSIEAKIQATFDSKDDFKAAKTAMKQAQSEYDAAARQVLDATHAKPEYKEALAKRKSAEAILDSSRAVASPTGDDDPKPKPDQATLDAAAQDQITAGLAMKKLESEALTSDPKVADARTKLDNARKDYEALHGQVQDAMQADPEWVAEKQRVDAADQQLAAAQQSMEQMAQQQHAAQAAQHPPTPSRSYGKTR